MLIYLNNFYNFDSNIPFVLPNLNFIPNTYGEEIENFNAIDVELEKVFSEILGYKIKIKEDSGVFRKPYEVIHFENFQDNVQFVAYVGIEKNKFKKFRHKETNCSNILCLDKSLDLKTFIQSNCYDYSKWEQIAEIELDLGDLILTRPWAWRALDCKVTQIFYLETENGS